MIIPTEAAARILLMINDKINYGGAITRKTGMTNGAIVNIIKRLQSNGIITKKETCKRKKIIQLTRKGEKLKFLLEEIQEL